MKSIVTKSLLAAAALWGCAFDASAQYLSTSHGFGNGNRGNYSQASGYQNNIGGGTTNHALGFQNGIAAGVSFNLVSGYQNWSGGNTNHVFGLLNAVNGFGNLVGGNNNQGTGTQNFTFGSLVSDNARMGCVTLTDANPFSVRTTAARFLNPIDNAFQGVFDRGYFFHTNSGQNMGLASGLTIIPSVANTATTSSPAFVGINKLLPAVALDVVGSGAFSEDVVVGTVGVGQNDLTVTGLNGNVIVNSGFSGVGTTLMGIFTGNTGGPQVRFQRVTGGIGFWDIGQDGSNNFTLEANDGAVMTVLQNGNVGLGATPTAKLDVRGDIKQGTTGQFFAAASTEKLSIIRGGVSGAGGILRGTGFTVARASAGNYTITFTTPFASAPTVTGSLSGFGYGHIVFGTPTTTTIQLFTGNETGTADADHQFDFIAVGPRP